MKNKAFMITHGAGTVITAIPALEKFARLNPENDFKVLIGGWGPLLLGHPVLQDRYYDINNHKGLFDLVRDHHIQNLEPYHVSGYINQQLHLTEAFDVLINGKNAGDLKPARLYPSKQEISSVKQLTGRMKEEHQKEKVVVFQPYGSGITVEEGGRPFDSSARSLDVDDYLYLAKMLAPHALVFYFGPHEFRHPGDAYTPDMSGHDLDLRFYLSLIHQCDYFLGVDSVGQHMARALDKPGTVILGGTSAVNTSYEDHFTIFRNDAPFTYCPIRISSVDSTLANRLNEKAMTFTIADLDSIVEGVLRAL